MKPPFVSGTRPFAPQEHALGTVIWKSDEVARAKLEKKARFARPQSRYVSPEDALAQRLITYGRAAVSTEDAEQLKLDL